MHYQTQSFTYYLFGDGLLTWLWLIVIALLFASSMTFLLRWKKFHYGDQRTTASLYSGYALFIGFFVITRISFLISDYYEFYGKETMFHEGVESIPEFQIAIRIAYVVSLFALTFFFYGLEKYILPTKHIIMIIPLVHGIISIFLPYDIMRVIMYYVQPGYFIVSGWAYYYMYKNSTGDLKKKSLLAMLGLILFYFGLFTDSKAVKMFSLENNMIWLGFMIPQFLTFLGILVFTYATGREQE